MLTRERGQLIVIRNDIDGVANDGWRVVACYILFPNAGAAALINGSHTTAMTNGIDVFICDNGKGANS